MTFTTSTPLAKHRRALHLAGAALRRRGAALAGALLLSLPILPAAWAATSANDNASVATWSAPMVSATPATNNLVNNQTLRQIAHVSVGGSKVRIKFSNRWGTSPLEVGAARVAIRTNDQNIAPATVRELTFGGLPNFTIPINGELLSDWVDLQVPPLADLAVDLYLSGDTSVAGSVLTVRNGALQTNYVSTTGNFAGSPNFPVAATRSIWQFMSAVDVVADRKMDAIVAFGDSITEGLFSSSNTNSRWPDVLARRIQQAPEAQRRGVVNQGISGNRVGSGGSTNPSALARVDSDALVQTSAAHMIVLLGINDISGGATADDVIANLRQLIVRARTQQIRIYGGTLTPFGNAPDAREAHRVAVNQWIRNSREFDGVVDFDAALRDPANPRRMLPLYDSGDSLHPSNAGYEAMGNAVNLTLFDTP